MTDNEARLMREIGFKAQRIAQLETALEKIVELAKELEKIARDALNGS